MARSLPQRKMQLEEIQHKVLKNENGAGEKTISDIPHL